MKKFYGYYTEEITRMVQRKQTEAINEKLHYYSQSKLEETTRDQLIGLLDFMDGCRQMADLIIYELQREVEEDGTAT